MKRTSADRRRCAAFAAVFPDRSGDSPPFQVDPLWPKPLPNHWLLGSVTGVAVDAQDHIWVVHRGYDSMTARTEIGAATNPKTADECCVPAPPVLEFDPAGNLLGHWGGPGRVTSGPCRRAASRSTPRGTSGSRQPARRRFPAARMRTAAAARTAAATGAATAGAQRRRCGAAARTRRRTRRRSRRTRTCSSSRARASSSCRSARPAQPGGSDSTTALNRPAGVERRCRRRRGLRRRRLRQPTRRRLRRRDRRLQAALGRVGRET